MVNIVTSNSGLNIESLEWVTELSKAVLRMESPSGTLSVHLSHGEIGDLARKSVRTYAESCQELLDKVNGAINA